MENNKVVIIPDVHGRTFWKKTIEKFPKSEFPNIKIIFLGDYLDPYTSIDNITKDQAFDNFLEIIETAKNDNRIILLLGNHDIHYWFFTDNCRIDFLRSKEIGNIFYENRHLFKFAHSEKINDTNYLFTHAGITQKWIVQIKQNAINRLSNLKKVETKEEIEFRDYLIYIANFKPSEESINNFLESITELNLISNLKRNFVTQVSVYRGGNNEAGSFIWADVQEHIGEIPIDDYFQIFSHSYGFPTIYDYYITDNFAMLDCAKSFLIDKDSMVML